MAIGNSYPIKPTVENYDLFLGTRNGTNNTVNYTAQAVVNYLNTSASIAVGGQLTFQFLVNEYESKSMFFPGGGGDNTPFSSITQLLISNADCSGNETNIFLEYLEGTDILISEQNHANIFGHYKITGYTVTATPGFYTLDLEYIGGNGNIQEDVYYNINSFILASNTSTPTLQQVTDAGDTTTTTVHLDGGALSDSVNEQALFQPDSISTKNKNSGAGAEMSSLGYVAVSPDGISSGIFAAEYITGEITLQFPNKPSGSYTIATTDDVPAIPTLQQVTDAGNTTNNEIYISDTDYLAIVSYGGISTSYNDGADSFDSYISATDIATRNITNNTSAALSSEGALIVNTNGNFFGAIASTYVTAEVFLEFPNKPSGTYTIAVEEDLTLQTVTDNGNTITGTASYKSTLGAGEFLAENTYNGTKLRVSGDGLIYFRNGNGKTSSLSNSGVYGDYVNFEFPNKPDGPVYTLATTVDIPSIAGYAKLTQLGTQTLAFASWSLSGDYYIYTFSNVNITATSVVDFTPDNASVNEVSSCRMLPQVDVASGNCTFYATFPPQSNITGTINVWQ